VESTPWIAGACEHDGADAAAGTTTRSALQIADRAADLGATLNSGAGTTRQESPALALAEFSRCAGIVGRRRAASSFPQAELSEYARSAYRNRAGKDEPFALAMRVLTSALYGPRHTYGYPDSGTTESIKAISREDVEHFCSRIIFRTTRPWSLRKHQTGVIKPLLEKRFGAWKAGRPLTGAGSPETTT